MHMNSELNKDEELQFIAYYLYVIFSITSLIWFLILGFGYLSNISTGN